jgi:DNA-binding XRE family transcriptional regulator
MENGDLGQRIRTIREALQMTQEDFAPLVGIHRVTLARIEMGASIGAETKRKLDEYLLRAAS